MLGLVQGVTEVVPVSSSAHLALVPWLLGWPQPAHRTTLAAGLHAGSCLGIAVATAARGTDRRTTAMVAATTVPAAAAGLLAADAVEDRLGRPGQLAALLAGAGLALWAADRRPQVRGVGPREAAVAALAQVVALAPGVSRSGATVTALRAAGVRRQQARDFSLLMSLPVTAGAAVLTLARADRVTLRALAGPLAVGVPCAAASALAVARLQQRRPAGPATGVAVYRLALAAAVAGRLRQTSRGPAWSSGSPSCSGSSRG